MNAPQDLSTYFALLNHVPLGIFILRQDYTVLFWNDYLAEWSHVSSAQIIGNPVGDFFPHLTTLLYTSRLDPIFAGGPPAIFSSQLHHHIIPASLWNGELRVQHTIVTAFQAPIGDEFYALFTIQDVTDSAHRLRDYQIMHKAKLKEMDERKTIEIELAIQRERVHILQELIRDVSHDLNTPLSVIYSSLFLLDSMDSPENREKQMKSLKRNIDYLKNIFDSLLTMFQLNHHSDFDYAPTSISQIMQDTYELLNPLAIEKQQTITLAIKDGCFVLGIEAQLRRVIANLVHNAIKYTPNGGTIFLSSYIEDKEVVVEVRDTGIGIPSDELPYIFDHFYRVDKARSTPGSGLGLAIVKKVAELHRGFVQVESQINEGSVFYLRLPTT